MAGSPSVTVATTSPATPPVIVDLPSHGPPAGTLALLSALYLVEGAPWGVQSQALPIYLREHHESLTVIGLVNALSLPWLAKPLIAPLVDRYGSDRWGRRKSWIVPLQMALMLTSLAGAFVVGHSDWTSILFVVFLLNTFAATMDIAVDALAVDLLRGRGLGTGNIAQVVGYKAGSLVSGGLLVWATASIGWTGLFVGVALLVLPVMIITALVREPAPEDTMPVAPPTFHAIWQMLRESLRQPGTFVFFAFIGTYKLGEQLVDSMFKPYLIDLGFRGSDVGLWVSTFGMVASLSGSFAGGILASRYRLVRVVTWTAVLRLLPLIVVTCLTLVRPTAWAVISSTVAEHFFGGMLTTATYALMMHRTDRRMGATHYSLIATIEMFGKAPIPMLAGPFADRYGYLATFGTGTLLSGLLLLLLIPLGKYREPAEG